LKTLCSIIVLDPACGTANFLYVTMEHMKRLEGEVWDDANRAALARAERDGSCDDHDPTRPRKNSGHVPQP